MSQSQVNNDLTWQVFLNPVKKGKEWEVDIGNLLDGFMKAEDGGFNGDDGRPNFTAAGLVIQGATHTWGRKVDALHDEVMGAVRDLNDNDDNEEEQTGNEVGGKTRRKKKENDYTAILENPYDFTIQCMKEAEDKDDDHPVELLPRHDPFFHDMVGDERGEELKDAKTGDYVAHRNDLWCYRAVYTGDRYLFPGETMNYEDKHDERAYSPVPMREDSPAPIPEDLSAGPFDPGMQPSTECDFEEVARPSNEAAYQNQPQYTVIHEHMDLDDMDINDCSVASFNDPPSADPSVAHKLLSDAGLGNWNIDALETWIPVINENCEQAFEGKLIQEIPDLPEEEEVNGIPANFLQEERRFQERSRFESGQLQMQDTSSSYAFDPKTRFTTVLPRKVPAIFSEPPMTMTQEMFVSIIDTHVRVHPRSKKSIQRDAQKVKQYNDHNRAIFGKNFRRFVSTRMGQDHATASEVLNGEAATNTSPETDAAFRSQFTAEDRTAIVDDHHPHSFADMTLNDPEPPSYPPVEPSTMGSSDNDILRNAAMAGIRQVTTQYTDTDMAVQVREWRQTINPKLEAETSLPVFDIRSVIHKLDEQLQIVDGTQSFDQLAAGCTSWERCRIFSGMLQMANEGKLRIIPPATEGTMDAIGAFSVRTLKDRQHVAGDDVELGPTGKRLRAPSSPSSSESPMSKRKSKA